MRAKVGDKSANFNLVGRGGGTGVTRLAKCESSQENEILNTFIQNLEKHILILTRKKRP